MQLKNIGQFLTDPVTRFAVLSGRGVYNHIPDDEYLRRLFLLKMGYPLNLENPSTFNEKLQWLKLHDRNPLYTTLVDKYEVKRWVAERIGEQCVVPTYGVWDSFDEIDFGELPERFVLKCTHDSGGLAICRDRSTFDMADARRRLERSLRRNYYWNTREWPYKNVPPRIIAEKYLDPAEGGDLVDYKLMCFGGNARCAFTCTGRSTGDLRVDFFGLDWNHLPFERHYPNADVASRQPSCLAEMRDAAEELSQGIPFVRVDFYDVGGIPRFGEMTFYPGAGFEEFMPDEWDERLGSWIDLPGSGGGVLLADEWLLWLHESDAHLVHEADVAEIPSMTDYKFYCFGGEPRYLYISKGLENHATARISFITLDWEFAPFGRPDYAPFYELPQRPGCFDDMVDVAKELSHGIPFVRVDLYEYRGSVLFSEMTFSPCGGFMRFDPELWDEELGNWIHLDFAYGR